MLKKIVNNRNLRQKVYEKVRDFIVSSAILPGAKIDEDALSRNLGVSKTPVREALSKLAHDGIVKIIPNRGAFKIKLFKKDIFEIMVIRETLEGLCIRLAVSNINDKIIKKLRAILDDFEKKDLEKDFHHYPEAMRKFYNLIYNTAKNPKLIRIIQSLYDLTNMFRVFYFNNPGRVNHSIEVHRKFIDVLEKRDEELAEKIRKEMVRSAYEYLLEVDRLGKLGY
jgi:DNA-binding GntR family transcriptional regulator